MYARGAAEMLSTALYTRMRLAALRDVAGVMDEAEARVQFV